METLIRRRFEVLFGACFLGLAFVLVVWAMMVLLKAINPVVFHFNLLMDILPWFTPVVIILALGGPLYWKVAGLLAPPQGGLQRLVAARFQLAAGAFFYLLTYSMVVWGTMVLLRVWNGQDFHYNLAVDWLPAILPPWLLWFLGAPLVYKSLAALEQGGMALRRSFVSWTAIAVTVLIGGGFLTGGGILVNQGMYTISEGGAVAVQQDLVAFGAMMLGIGAVSWAIMLGYLWLGWRPVEVASSLARPLDRFRLQRARIVAQGFVLANLMLAAAALLMVAAQYVDAEEFHFYLAKDMWAFGLPLMVGWMIFAVAAYGLPAWLAARDPGRFAAGVGIAEGPSGAAAPGEGWGYRGRDLVASGSGS